MGKREGSFRQKKEEWILGKPMTSVMLSEWDGREERAQGRMREVYLVMISKADVCAMH